MPFDFKSYRNGSFICSHIRMGLETIVSRYGRLNSEKAGAISTVHDTLPPVHQSMPTSVRHFLCCMWSEENVTFQNVDSVDFWSVVFSLTLVCDRPVKEGK